MTRRQATTIMGVFAALLITLASWAVGSGVEVPLPALPAPAPVPVGYYKVTELHDGDTFTVDMNGQPERIRLIGVDTPETHKPGAPVQCFGPEASEFTKQLLRSSNVRLEADTSGDNRDRYNRLLRYAYLPDGRLLNQLLIDEGYGFAYLSFTFQKKEEFAAAQQKALDAKRGVWAACTPKLQKSGRWQSNDL